MNLPKKLFLLNLILFSISSQSTESKLRNHVNYLASDRLEGRAPGTKGHELAIDYIKNQLNGIGLEMQILEHRPYLPWMPKVKNLIAKIPGQNRSKTCVVLTAHYDHLPANNGHLFPGAMDNAASVAVLLELARSIMKSKSKAQADIYFAFPDQEEKYISGSPFLVKHLKKVCGKILFDFNFDVIGKEFFKGMENHFLLLGSESSSSFDHIIPSKLPRNLEISLGGIYMIEPFSIPRSDYTHFRKAGIPFIFVTNGTPHQYHTPLDRPHILDYGHLQQIHDFSLEMMNNFIISESYLPFKYSSRGNKHYSRDGHTMGDILKKLTANSRANNLTAKEMEKVNNHIARLTSRKAAKKWEIQAAVVDLLKIISAKRSKINQSFGIKFNHQHVH